MRLILIISSLLFSSQAFSQSYVVKSCFTELGCAYYAKNLTTERETLYAPKAIFDRVTSEMKTQLNNGGYRLALVTAASEKFLSTQIKEVVKDQTIKDAEEAVTKASKESIIGTAMCAFSGMTCGLSFSTPLNWLAIIPNCGSGLVTCYDSSLKMREWWKAKEKLYQLKKAEIEAKEEAIGGGSGGGSDPNNGPQRFEGSGPGDLSDGVKVGGPDRLPDGKVISVDCPDGGC